MGGGQSIRRGEGLPARAVRQDGRGPLQKGGSAGVDFACQPRRPGLLLPAASLGLLQLPLRLLHLRPLRRLGGQRGEAGDLLPPQAAAADRAVGFARRLQPAAQLHGEKPGLPGDEALVQFIIAVCRLRCLLREHKERFPLCRELLFQAQKRRRLSPHALQDLQALPRPLLRVAGGLGLGVRVFQRGQPLAQLLQLPGEGFQLLLFLLPGAAGRRLRPFGVAPAL